MEYVTLNNGVEKASSRKLPDKRTFRFDRTEDKHKKYTPERTGTL